MATYGIKYYHEFLSYSENKYRVELLFKDYTGAATAIQHTARTPVRLRHNGDTKDEWDDKFILGQELLFNFLVSQNDVDMWDTEVFESQYKDYKIRFYSYDGITKMLEFEGYLKPENLSKSFVNNPEYIEINLSATDALAELKEYEYRDITNPELYPVNPIYKDRFTLLQIIKQAIANLGIDLDFKIQLNTYETTYMTSSECPLKICYANARRFYSIEENEIATPDDCYIVIEKILKTFNCKLMQYKGYYQITNYHELESYEYVFDWGGLTQQSRTATTNTIDATDYVFHSRIEQQKVFPISGVTITFENRDIGGDLIVGLDDWSSSGPWNLTSWYTTAHPVIQGVVDKSIINLTSQLTDGSKFEYTQVGAHLTFKATFAATSTSQNDYIEIRLKYRLLSMVSTQLTEVPPMMLRVKIQNPSGVWTPVDYFSYWAPLYGGASTGSFPGTITFEDTNDFILFASPHSEVFRVTEDGEYNIRLDFIPYPGYNGWLYSTFQVKEVEVTKISEGVMDEFNPGEIIYETRWTQAITTGYEVRDVVLYLLDSGQITDIGALLVYDDGYKITKAWNTYNDSEGLIIGDIYARNRINNRVRYKNFLPTITIMDKGETIGFNNVLDLSKSSTDPREYCFSDYEWDVRKEEISGRVIELLTTKEAYSVAVMEDSVTVPYAGTDELESPILQEGHGFTVGDVVAYNPDTALYFKPVAIMNEDGTIPSAVGIISNVLNENEFYIITEGLLSNEDVVGDGVILGQFYYLSTDDAGEVFMMPYSWAEDSFVQPIGYATASGFIVKIEGPTNTLVAYNKSGVITTDTEGTVTGDGSDESPITLVNDEGTPAALNYYGTDATATKGYHDLLAIIKASITDETKHKTAVDNTTLATYTYKTDWSTNLLSAALGHFAVNVLVKDKTTNEITTLKNVFSWDYVDATDVEIDNEIVVDADSNAMTLVLDVESDGMLSATLSNMSTNPKRLFFCFERCIAVVEDLSMGAEGTFELNAVATLASDGMMVGDGLLALNAVANKAAGGALAAAGTFALDGAGALLDDRFITEWDMPVGDFTLPLRSGYTYDMTVDWGDGSAISTVTAYNDTDATHTYAAGTYQIIITGTCESWYINNGAIKTYITKVIKWGDVGVTAMDNSFKGCSNLTSLAVGGIRGSTNPSFLYAFFNCSSLTSIPTDLFKYSTGVTTFFAALYGSGLTSIHEDTFKYNTLVTDFSYILSHCTGLSTLPTNLFRYNVNVLTFYYAFSSMGIITIPSELFAYNSEVTDFQSAFSSSSITSVPSGLFDNNTKVTNFSFTFYICYSLTTIPDDLFDNNTLVTTFFQTFRLDNAITSDVPDLWNTHSGATHTYCFGDCVNANNYASIPSDWK